jgi:hypothetical protein
MHFIYYLGSCIEGQVASKQSPDIFALHIPVSFKYTFKPSMPHSLITIIEQKISKTHFLNLDSFDSRFSLFLKWSVSYSVIIIITDIGSLLSAAS